MPDEMDSRITNMVYLMMGMLVARSVQTGRLASHVPLRVKRLSIVRRLERFLDNGAVRVRTWYADVARGLLRTASASGQVALIIDGTKVSINHQLLMVAVAYHGRALPIAWTWVCSGRGHSSQHKQLALLGAVRDVLPSGVRVSVVGVTEFGHTFVLEYLDHWGWDYALRQAGHYQVWPPGATGWLRLDRLSPTNGNWRWLPRTVLTVDSAYPARLLLFWAQGETRPWLLATNLAHPPAVLRLYCRRMWIEELFGDLKRHGFDLESSHLRSFLRLNRLTLAVVLLYVWLVCEGTQALIQGRTTRVDRTNRRDLSLFRIGLELVQQALTWLEPFQVHWQPVFDPFPLFFAQATVG
jgi:hypothetical protein